MPVLSPEEIDKLARRRAGAKLGWYTHACVYVVVNAFLLGTSYLGIRTRGYEWGPALGWGLGLALHFVAVFVMAKGSGVRENLVQRERERIERDQQRP